MTRIYQLALCTSTILAGLVLGEITSSPIIVLSIITSFLAADPNDWVNVNYALQQVNGPSDTSLAQQSILSKAGIIAKSGPWSMSFSDNLFLR